MWPPTSQDLNLCIYYLWGRLKDTVYVNNPHSLQEIKYLKTNCKYFKIQNMTCVEKYFQKLQGLFRSWGFIKSHVNWTAGVKLTLNSHHIQAGFVMKDMWQLLCLAMWLGINGIQWNYMYLNLSPGICTQLSWNLQLIWTVNTNTGCNVCYSC